MIALGRLGFSVDRQAFIVFGTVDVVYLPSHLEAGFGRAITNDFCCGGKGSWCSYEGSVYTLNQNFQDKLELHSNI